MRGFFFGYSYYINNEVSISKWNLRSHIVIGAAIGEAFLGRKQQTDGRLLGAIAKVHLILICFTPDQLIRALICANIERIHTLYLLKHFTLYLLLGCQLNCLNKKFHLSGCCYLCLRVYGVIHFWIGALISAHNYCCLLLMKITR